MTVTVKTVSVNYERKINLGNYESAAVGCTLWADVTEDQNLDEAMKALWEMARANVKSQAQQFAAKPGASMSTEEMFLGLPLADAGPLSS